MAAFHFGGTASTDISWVKATDNTSAKHGNIPWEIEKK